MRNGHTDSYTISQWHCIDAIADESQRVHQQTIRLPAAHGETLISFHECWIIKIVVFENVKSQMFTLFILTR